MSVQKVGQWALAKAAIGGAAAKLNKAAERALKQEAQMFRAAVVRAFTTGGKSNGKAWVPLQPDTIRAKGSSKPLIDSGQLRQSVQVVEQGKEIFVGVPNKATRSGGGPLVDIAAVHEFGKIIAQQRGGRVVLIKIPERSFIRATAKAHFDGDTARDRYFARIAAIMGPGWVEQVPTSAKALTNKTL